MVSTYTGAGGLDLGFEWAGFEPIWANDIDSDSVDTYNAMRGKDIARKGDITNQELSRIPI